MARAKFKFNDGRKFKRLIRDLKKEIPETLRDSILKDIGGGRSPVKGKDRFKQYSDGYKKKIKGGKDVFSLKRIRPINMTLTGEMISSFFSRLKGNTIVIGFDDPKADFHNRLGAGKSKVVRRLLPTQSGEEFNRSIQTDLRDTLNRVANKIFG